MNSPVMSFFNKLTDLLFLNILWLVCSLPIITIGASTTAMYYVSITSIRMGDGYVAKRFFKSFVDNFKQATIIWIGMLLVGTVLVFDLSFGYRMIDGVLGKIVFVSNAVIAFVFLLVAMYIFPILSKFKNKIFTNLKNAVAMAIGYLPYTMVMLGILAVFFYANYISLAVNTTMFLFGFALLSYILSFFFYRVFRKHFYEEDMVEYFEE